MKLSLLTFIFSVVLTGCVTETRYSSHMIGNNLNTTTGNFEEDQSVQSYKECDDCSLVRPIIRPAN